VESGLLQVEYVCHGCGLGVPPAERPKVTVRHRGPGQDVVEWVNDCAALVGADHRRRSPQCREEKCDLMIPMPKDDSTPLGGIEK